MSNNDTAIKKAISDMLAESRTYITMEGLKSRKKLEELLKDYTLNEKQFTPIELFFIAETSPALKTAISNGALQEAYCAAVKQLNPDWWGFPSSTRAEVAKHLVSIPGVATCLEAVLGETSQLRYEDGESNTLAKALQWQTGDLAAGFISAIHNEEYDFRAPLEERLKAREALRKK